MTYIITKIDEYGHWTADGHYFFGDEVDPDQSFSGYDFKAGDLTHMLSIQPDQGLFEVDLEQDGSIKLKRLIPGEQVDGLFKSLGEKIYRIYKPYNPLLYTHPVVDKEAVRRWTKLVNNTPAEDFKKIDPYYFMSFTSNLSRDVYNELHTRISAFDLWKQEYAYLNYLLLEDEEYKDGYDLWMSGHFPRFEIDGVVFIYGASPLRLLEVVRT